MKYLPHYPYNIDGRYDGHTTSPWLTHLDSVSGVDPDVASGNDPGFATPTDPPQTSDETRASPKSRWKRKKRHKTRRTNTKAVEKLYQKKRRLEQAAKLRNAKKTDGSAAEVDEEEGAGQFSDSDCQHDLPAAKVKCELLLQPSSPFQC